MHRDKPQIECLLECVARRTEGCSFHYREATKWVKQDYPGTYSGKTPFNNVHRDLSRMDWIEKVGDGTGMFRVVNPASRPLPRRERRKYRKVAKLLRKAIALLEKAA